MIKTILLSVLMLCSMSTVAQKYYERQIAWANVQDIHKIMVQNDTSFAVFGNYSFFPFVWKISSFVMNINLQGDSICGKVYEDIENTLGILDATKTNDGYAVPLNVYVDENNTYSALLTVDSCGNNFFRSDYVSQLGNTNCYTIARTFDNGYLIGGSMHAPMSYTKPYLLKVSELGDVLWERAYTNVPKDGVVGDILPAADSSGYYILSSYNYDELNYTLKTRITKINEDGDSILLDKIYNFETDYFTGAELVYDYDGNIMMGGVRHPYSYSGYVAKLDAATLDTIWVHRSKAGGCSNIIPLADGNYIIDLLRK